MNAANNSLTERQVAHIAHLARLEITEEELTLFTRQLSSILHYVNQLEELDTGTIDATFTVNPTVNVMREDAMERSLPVEEVLRNAPDREGSYLRMPPILGDEE
ncbi:MAG: Asp-tRNA(Asn)/Glu-tRNA(Gln) amidotransferase subunit GatC [Candidatus Eremiobacteraeota bacterium]|nr:Asp-tRNA(Asn)/Glu-tRNA(Gln) amidotransferase subunit GatC [Candidatus Eremiobacteraeota bacterium]